MSASKELFDLILLIEDQIFSSSTHEVRFSGTSALSLAACLNDIHAKIEAMEKSVIHESLKNPETKPPSNVIRVDQWRATRHIRKDRI